MFRYYSSEILLLTFQGGASFVDHFCLVFVMFSCTSVLYALWSPVGKGLTSWHSFVMSNGEDVTFSLVSWVRCGGRVVTNVD